MCTYGDAYSRTEMMRLRRHARASGKGKTLEIVAHGTQYEAEEAVGVAFYQQYGFHASNSEAQTKPFSKRCA